MQKSDLKERIRKVIAEEIAPALDMDGTKIEVVEVEDGVAQVRLGGACGGCASSIMAVIMGVEQELRRRVPEVDCIEAIP